MEMITLTNEMARRFMLAHQGLLGGYRWQGAAGVLAYVRQAGCIQFDPIDVCGNNPQLALQSRVKGFAKPQLESLLYKKRQLVDYFDKQLSIFPVEDWPQFAPMREYYREKVRSHGEITQAAQQVHAALAQQESICSKDLALDEKVDWYWSHTRLGRAVLEALYFQGELGIHHKQSGNKYYGPIQRLLPPAVLQQEPLEEEAQIAWWVLRRIGAVGLLWNRGSDAFLGMDLAAGQRNNAFERLLQGGQIIPVQVEGMGERLYCPKSAEPILQEIMAGKKLRRRMELLAPLDCLLWDRKLVQALFGFHYKWEIYTPAAQRRYGYYVLPLVWGESFVGRAELVCRRKEGVLEARRLWLEPGVRPSPALLEQWGQCLARFAEFNDCSQIEQAGDFLQLGSKGNI